MNNGKHSVSILYKNKLVIMITTENRTKFRFTIPMYIF